MSEVTDVDLMALSLDEGFKEFTRLRERELPVGARLRVCSPWWTGWIWNDPGPQRGAIASNRALRAAFGEVPS